MNEVMATLQKAIGSTLIDEFKEGNVDEKDEKFCGFLATCLGNSYCAEFVARFIATKYSLNEEQIVNDIVDLYEKGESHLVE